MHARVTGKVKRYSILGGGGGAAAFQSLGPLKQPIASCIYAKLLCAQANSASYPQWDGK